jgi:hypothetical protein
MLVIDKQAMYEAVCRAQSEEVHPEDYGFENNDYESLWNAVQSNGHLLMVDEDGGSFRDEGNYRVYLYKECGFDTPEQLQLVWAQSKSAVELFAESVGIKL